MNHKVAGRRCQTVRYTLGDSLTYYEQIQRGLLVGLRLATDTDLPLLIQFLLI